MKSQLQFYQHYRKLVKLRKFNREIKNNINLRKINNIIINARDDIIYVILYE